MRKRPRAIKASDELDDILLRAIDAKAIDFELVDPVLAESAAANTILDAAGCVGMTTAGVAIETATGGAASTRAATVGAGAAETMLVGTGRELALVGANAGWRM